MNTLRDDLENDLERKFCEDMRRAMLHYADMCTIAEIPTSTQWASLMGTMARALIEMAIASNMPKDVVLSALERQWDAINKRKERAAS